MTLQDVIDTSPLADDKSEDLTGYEVWFKVGNGTEVEVTSAKFVYDSGGTRYIMLS